MRKANKARLSQQRERRLSASSKYLENLARNSDQRGGSLFFFQSFFSWATFGKVAERVWDGQEHQQQARR